MLGIIFAFSISWLILFFIEKKSILALGFLPLIKRFRQFFIGFLITAVLCVFVQFSESLFKSSSWILNENITWLTIVKSFYWDFKSVLTEELVFRGAILYVLIQKIGSKKAILISAICFGIYHWFSFGVLGNIIAMIIVFFGTGFMGYAWALAFSKTKSIMLPLGFHLGWNFVHNTIFSKGPLGELILISKGGNELTDWVSLINFSMGLIFVPTVLLIYLRYFVNDSKEEDGELNKL